MRAMQLLCLAALGWICAPVVSAATRVDLNAGWTFVADRDSSGVRAGWNQRAPSGGERVEVPHSWNRGVGQDYLGIGWYFRSFELPSLPADAHVELNFGATFYSARVWLNGEEIGAHEGGFTAYAFDITRRLRATNTIAVAIDNRPGIATIPGYGARGTPEAWYDWWAYGGIVRDVWLSVSGPVHVKRQRIVSDIDGSGAAVGTRVALVSSASQRQTVTVKATALDPEGKEVATQAQSVQIDPGAGGVSLSLKIPQVQLWNLDTPHVYRMRIEVADAAGKQSDTHEDSFGVRRIEIRNRHLLINGERVRLTGMTRHEDSPWEGLAETQGTMRFDFDDMKALHTTVSRPVHYPQHPFILDYADRNGILMIPEIPIWQFSEAQLADPKVIALAKQQVREMIEESGNHPSIFAWSVANESATGSPAGIAFFRALRDFIRELDPARFVTYADDNLPKLTRAEESAAKDADFLLMNQYFGAWHGPAEALGAALDKVDRLFPDKMVMISEFGFPGIFASNPEEADRKRVEIIRAQLPEMARRDWIAGAMLWCYQDYRSRRNLWSGQVEGYVEHGLVNEWRQRKPSYLVWKDLNAPAKIDARRTPAGFKATVTPNAPDQIPFHPLRDYRLVWRAFGQDGKQVARGEQAFADLKKPQSVSGPSAFRLTFTLLRPNGSVAAEKSLQ